MRGDLLHLLVTQVALSGVVCGSYMHTCYAVRACARAKPVQATSPGNNLRYARVEIG